MGNSLKMDNVTATAYTAHNTTHHPYLLGSPVPLNDTSGPEDPSIISSDVSVAMGALILSLVFLVGVPGNAFVIWSILVHTRRRSVTTILILNLAVADGCLMLLTIFFVAYLALQTWVFGLVMCKLLFYLCNANMYASIMLITLMSLHRLVAVVWPHLLRAASDRRTVVYLLAGLWLLVLVIAVPSVVFRVTKSNRDRHGGQRILCDPSHNQSGHLVFHYTTETVLGFLVPYAVIIVSYMCILHRLRQTQFRRAIRSENLILAIVVTFGIFWLPYHVMNMVQVTANLSTDSLIKERLNQIWRSSRAATSSLAFISSCANPVLYTFAGKSYIHKDGLAFMARLFDGTVLEQGAKKIQQMKRERQGLREPEMALSPTTSTSPVRNGP